MRILAIAAGTLAVFSAHAAAASSFAGEWTGELAVSPSIKETCGFVKTPFRIVVTDGEFVATGTDGSDNERTLDGDVGADGSNSEWSAWRAFGYNAEAQTQQAKLTGRFIAAEFTGDFYRVDTSQLHVCAGKIVLKPAT